MSANGQKPDGSPFDSDAILSESLQQAFLPDSLDAKRNELLIEQALARHIGAPSSKARESHATGPNEHALHAVQDIEEGTLLELEQAEKLTAALDGTGSHPLAELAEVILSAHAPSAILPSLHEQLVARAINSRAEFAGEADVGFGMNPQRNEQDRGDATAPYSGAQRRPDFSRALPITEKPTKAKANRVWVRLAPALALAAGVALWFGFLRSPGPHSEATISNQLVRTRSVSPLFVETLDQPTPTERIDRIYAVRSKELRHNRYTLWRVR